MKEALKPILKDYVATFLTPCRRDNYSRELVQYPRTRSMPEVQQFGQYPPNLQAKNWRVFRCNVDRAVFPDGRNHHWILMKYPQPVSRSFLPIDIDRHHKNGETPEEFSAIEEKFWAEIQDIIDSGLPGFFTTTPGQLYEGRVLQGLNFNLSFDSPLSSQELIDLESRIFKALGWSGHESTTRISPESNCTRNYRPPGEYHVQMAAVDPGIGMVQETTHSFSEFLTAWATRPITSKEEVLEVIEGLSESAVFKPEKHAKPVLMKTTPAEQEILDCASSMLSGTTPKDAWSIDECLSHKDTFLAFTRRKIGSRLAIKYRGKMDKLDLAVAEGISELKQIRPSTSNTCSTPYLCHKTMERWLSTYYFGKFDPSKCGNGGARDSERDEKRRKAWAYNKSVSISSLLSSLSGFSLSSREKEIVAEFWKRQKEWNGSVAVKAIYDENGFCSRASWFSLMRKISGVFTILDNHSKQDSKCRQWGISEAHIKRIRNREIREKRQQERRKFSQQTTEEKKRESVYVCLPAHTLFTPILPLSESSSVDENQARGRKSGKTRRID